MRRTGRRRRPDREGVARACAWLGDFLNEGEPRPVGGALRSSANDDARRSDSKTMNWNIDIKRVAAPSRPAKCREPSAVVRRISQDLLLDDPDAHDARTRGAF